MIVEMDPRTFDLKILKYVVVHDCGTVINPMILAARFMAASRKDRQCILREAGVRRSGQLLNASLADYLLPTHSKCRAWSSATP